MELLNLQLKCTLEAMAVIGCVLVVVMAGGGDAVSSSSENTDFRLGPAFAVMRGTRHKILVFDWYLMSNNFLVYYQNTVQYIVIYTRIQLSCTSLILSDEKAADFNTLAWNVLWHLKAILESLLALIVFRWNLFIIMDISEPPKKISENVKRSVCFFCETYWSCQYHYVQLVMTCST